MSACFHDSLHIGNSLLNSLLQCKHLELQLQISLQQVHPMASGAAALFQAHSMLGSPVRMDRMIVNAADAMTHDSHLCKCCKICQQEGAYCLPDSVTYHSLCNIASALSCSFARARGVCYCLQTFVSSCRIFARCLRCCQSLLSVRQWTLYA